MSQEINCHALVELLSHYGMKRTSMSDFAKAAGVTRQTLYNRFGTKDAVRDWAILEFMREVNDTAIACLDAAGSNSPFRAIEEAFDRWGGDHVPLILNSPHGAEILEAGVKLIARLPETPIEKFEHHLGRFLVETGLSRSPDQTAMLLVFAAKGVFVSSPDQQFFSAQMKQVIQTVLT